MNNDQRRYLTVPEAADYVRSTPGSIRFKLSKGTLPYLKLGRRTLLDINDLDAIIHGVTAPARPTDTTPESWPICLSRGAIWNVRDTLPIRSKASCYVVFLELLLRTMYGRTGAVIVSERRLAGELGLGHQQIRTALRHLKSQGIITQQKSTISIVDLPTYIGRT